MEGQADDVAFEWLAPHDEGDRRSEPGLTRLDKAMAIGRRRCRPKPPEVTIPRAVPLGETISAPSRAGARPAGLRPTRVRHGPSASARWMRAAPGKPPSRRRRFESTRPARPRLDRSTRPTRGHKGTGPPRGAATASPVRSAQPIGQQQARERFGLGCGQRYLVSVLACVAGTGGEGLDAPDADRRRAHELHRLDTLSGRETRERRRRERTLQRDERGLGQRRHPDVPRRSLAEKREVRRLARSIDDEAQAAVRSRRAGDHQVVNDASLIVQQLAIALPPRLKAEEIGRAQRLSGIVRQPHRNFEPSISAWPMCETSNRPARLRVWRCSARTPVG